MIIIVIAFFVATKLEKKTMVQCTVFSFSSTKKKVTVIAFFITTKPKKKKIMTISYCRFLRCNITKKKKAMQLVVVTFFATTLLKKW